MKNIPANPAPDVILFGGTFDPPHAGHIACVTHVKQLFPSALVEILPGLETMKAGGDAKKPAASFAQRLEMCRLSFQQDAPLSGVSVSDVEAKLPQPSYTVNLLQRFITEHPGQRVAILMGMDQFINFPTWYKAQVILAISDLVVIKREHGSTRVILGDVICNQAAYSLNSHVLCEAAQIKETGRTVYFLDKDISVAASCKIRAMIKAKQQPPQGWLTESVAKYIEKWALYG